MTNDQATIEAKKARARQRAADLMTRRPGEYAKLLTPLPQAYAEIMVDLLALPKDERAAAMAELLFDQAGLLISMMATATQGDPMRLIDIREAVFRLLRDLSNQAVDKLMAGNVSDDEKVTL